MKMNTVNMSWLLVVTPIENEIASKNVHTHYCSAVRYAAVGRHSSSTTLGTILVAHINNLPTCSSGRVWGYPIPIFCCCFTSVDDDNDNQDNTARHMQTWWVEVLCSSSSTLSSSSSYFRFVWFSFNSGCIICVFHIHFDARWCSCKHNLTHFSSIAYLQYSGTNAEFTKADTVIFRTDLYNMSSGKKEYNFKRTLKYDSIWLDSKYRTFFSYTIRMSLWKRVWLYGIYEYNCYVVCLFTENGAELFYFMFFLMFVCFLYTYVHAYEFGAYII